MKCSKYVKKFITLVNKFFGSRSKDRSKDLSLEELEVAIMDAELKHLIEQSKLLKSQRRLSWVTFVAKVFLIPLAAWVVTNLDFIKTLLEKL